MPRYNTGTIYTNNKCIGCNRCVATCPVLGANISIVKDGSTHIEVSRKNCINCGSCMAACSHGAREYRDDTDRLFEDLYSKKNISLLVDPSFYIMYGTLANKFLGYLKSLGINKIYDVSYGADISAFMHIKYLKDNMCNDGTAKAFISQTCSSVVTYIEQCLPELIPYIIPVESPSVSLTIYLKKYLKITDDLVYLSPCISKIGTQKSKSEYGNVDYHVTFKHLFEKFKKLHISKDELDTYYAEADLTSDGMGNIFSVKEGFIEAVRPFFDRNATFRCYNTLNENLIRTLKLINLSNSSHPLLAEINSCEEGCISSVGNDNYIRNYETIMCQYEEKRKKALDIYYKYDTCEERYNTLLNKYSNLDYNDFTHEFSNNYKQPFIIPQNTLEDIYMAMYKDTPKKRVINCRSCGYNTCREMIEAVANGYSKMENCVHYMNDMLRMKYYTDAQTGLSNEKGFYKDYVQLIADNPDDDFTFCVGNINKLRVINNLYGTSVGDKIIRYFAKFIQELVEDNGICARLEGGHFGICMKTDALMKKNLSSIKSFDCKHLGVDFPVTIRCGVYHNINKSDKLEKIINYASYTMDKINDTTQNVYLIYNESHEREIKNDASITSSMKQAMSNDEFILFLQPQYDSAQKLVGAEALSRWVKPDGTMISPGIFIPIFEKNGFIREMDKHVWEKGFILIREWMNSGKDLVPISVNISRISLMDDNIIDIIKNLQSKYQINPEYLHFEITESAYMENQDELIKRVAKIRDMGFMIAMDDFGSGYSSLNTLKDVPLDILKLDMGFFRGEENIDRGKNIIEHVISMAHSLGLTTVAEGVETNEQADFLHSLNCDVIQGYLYAKPMPLESYEKLIK